MASSLANRHIFLARLELHPPRPCVTLLLHFPISLLNFIPYSLLYAFVYIPQLHSINMEPMASLVRNHYSQKNQEAHLERALARALQKTANFHSQSNVWTPTQPLCIVLKITIVRAMILMQEDDDDTDRETSDDDIEAPRESTLSWNIKEDDLDTQQEVLHLDQAHHDKTLWTTRDPLWKTQNCADTFIAHTWFPNLRHPAGAIAAPLLKCQKSTIIISLVWCCTGTPVSEGWWRPQCSSMNGQWRSQRSSTPLGYFWGSETVHWGNRIRRDSLRNHVQWEVLDGWQSLANYHWSPGTSVGLGRCSCRYTTCVTVAPWCIS